MSTIGKSVVPPGGPSGDPPPIIDGSHDGSPGPMERSSPIQVSLDGTGTADGVVTVGSMIDVDESPESNAGSPDGDAGSPGGDAGSPGGDAGSPGGDAGSPGGDGGSPGRSFPPFESGTSGKLTQKSTNDVDILSKLARDVELISTEVTRIGSAAAWSEATCGDWPRGRRRQAGRIHQGRSMAGMSTTNVYCLQRELTDAEAQISARDLTISDLRHANAFLRNELERVHAELREEKRRSGELQRKLAASNRNLKSTTATLKQVSASVSKIGTLVNYSGAAYGAPCTDEDFFNAPESAIGSSLVNSKTLKGGERKSNPRLRTDGGKAPFRPSLGTLRKAVDIYSRN
ncbi:hypothetical protein Pmar_PMAR003591 [Perkinsus marinus ATCC 50983]|uniref:Uncharacterized protein n=1 Tax=Perkinsus marinus (strain ATCC 50983 / TXsc) TaxID=423536 RepID=C5KHR6_PERM5|nr:hypothetical protein Pmar_PMAR003591 [Perkinsus marinus ATCC 50983]EER16128.1 hypothetical protein Pmar_PMAR003591 [Perkinsus marinus ATCC 50983]|eukprot:XP_002784332.1 hypothetical protein Pmar_PMAR003591 [Perkinsus marinus ATCC 50983]